MSFVYSSLHLFLLLLQLRYITEKRKIWSLKGISEINIKRKKQNRDNSNNFI